ncbi:MAG: hydrolase [Pseudopedobacter saltans]|uniref:Hydrolase n=1 Tax=Pseudopedobacter saltans TaxID=151895 RepID=A0A2W5EET0_9SPHI|nr:MAG: hydrolase [Pseudopedobacter saltans]
MRKKRVVITHGYQSKPSRNWFIWLKSELEKQSIEVLIPSLPNPEHPDRSAWLESLETMMSDLDKDTFLVAHSLGCITDLYFLDKMSKSIGGLILVAGFAERLVTIPELSDYTSLAIDFEKIITLTPHRVVFGSAEDYIVPFAATKRMAENLDAELVSISDSGHFMEEDGYVQFPALLIKLEDMMKS